MSFGWSAGDVISGVKLLISILGSLQDANGSRTHFQELESELQGLSRALSEIASLADGSHPVQTPEMLALKFVACSCEGTLKRFYEKIKPFEASLGVQSVKGKLKAAPKMVRWELLMKKEIPELRSYLAAHVGYLNMRLSTAVIKSVAENRSLQKESTEILSQELRSQTQSMYEKVIQIPTESSIPKVESLLVTVNKLWKTQEDMMGVLTKAMVQLPPPDTRHTWAQAPVTLEDALGRQIPVPSEYDWTMLHAVIQARFREGPGYAKVRSGEYELFMNMDSSRPVTTSTFPGLIPGTRVTMYMIVGQYSGSERCPRIGCKSTRFEGQSEGGSICVQCRTWFRRSSKPLPKPLKPPIDYMIMGGQDSEPALSQITQEPEQKLQNASSDRRCYKNYPRGYGHTPHPLEQKITAVQKVFDATIPILKRPTGPTVSSRSPQSKPSQPLLVSFTAHSPSVARYHKQRTAHSVVMRPMDYHVRSRRPPASVGPVPYRRPGESLAPTSWFRAPSRSSKPLPHPPTRALHPPNPPTWSCPSADLGKGNFDLDEDLPIVKDLALPEQAPVGLGVKENTNETRASTTASILSIEMWKLLIPFLGRPELRFLTQLCKPIRSIIEPYLYADLRWMDDDVEGLFGARSRLCLLVRSILRRPRLAGFVKHISLMVYDKIGTVRFFELLTKSDMKLAASFIKKACLLPDTQFIEELRRGNCDAVVVLLISLLWKLETLKITIGKPDGHRCLVGNALSLNAFRVYGLRSLDRLKTIELRANIVNSDEAEFTNTYFQDEIDSLFVLPSLESVTLTAFGAGVLQRQWAYRVDAINLKSLTINRCSLNENDLENLLAALCPSLEILEVEFCDYPSTEALDSALKPVQHSLRHLAIRLQYLYVPTPKVTKPKRIGKLTSYSSLRYLELPFALLRGDDSEGLLRLEHLLPKQLQTLCCTDDAIYSSFGPLTGPEQVITALTDDLIAGYFLEKANPVVIADLESYNPKCWGCDFLKEIIFKFPETSLPEDSWTPLKLLCAWLGVRCRIIFVSIR